MAARSIPALRVARELQSEVLPVYLLTGPDLYLRERAVDAFIASIDPGLRQFNVSSFSAAGWARCLDTARTLPMMSPRRLVILEGLSELEEEAWDCLYAYLQDPNPRTILLLSAEKLHEARVRKIAKSAVRVSAEEPEPSDARAMAEGSFRKDGFELEPGALDELLDQTGTRIQAMAQDIEKLKLFRLQEKRISSQDVAALSNRVRSVVIWDLIDQIAARNRKQLLVSLHRILEGGAEPLVLAKSLYTHFASLLSVKELEGRSEAAIAKVADMKPYNVKRLMTQSRGFRVEELLFALRQLHQTDSALKSRSIGGKQLLEAVLIRIIAQRPRGNSPAHISRPSS